MVTGQFVARQFVADISLQTIRRMDNTSHKCSWYIESSPHKDKKRRWRAKKKDQHHRTQNASHQYSSGINENFMLFCVKN
ncbi:unnamed protein product [Rotaria magnacalcarata]|uniref:Uncharacterized protein n=2 Tax=Rotaria magnacalcarata TaxID=392030 RepID=A0A816S180_9BILA|nr:unnamed protein product [Rotaria magnacalcarata]